MVSFQYLKTCVIGATHGASTGVCEDADILFKNLWYGSCIDSVLPKKDLYLLFIIAFLGIKGVTFFSVLAYSNSPSHVMPWNLNEDY